MSKEAIELVVGADSMIGAALVRALQAAGRPVQGTTRRAFPKGDYRLLNLNEVSPVWSGPPVAAAYFCAGITNMETCRRDPAGSHRVNVEGILRLARGLAETGAFLIFLSTNQVYDGSRPYRRPAEAPCPITEYGRQKALAEAGLLDCGGAVVRLTKVLGESVPLFAGWAAAAIRGEPIQAFADMFLAPVPLTTAVSLIMNVGIKRRPGIVHLSGARDVSYSEAAHLGLTALGANGGLIQPTSVVSMPTAAAVPRFTTLDDETIPAQMGISIPEVEATIRSAFLRSRPPQAPSGETPATISRHFSEDRR